MKRAFITGITGQDGSYLAELLLAKGYGRALARLIVDGDTEALSHAGRPWIDTVNLPSWSGP